MNHIIEPCFIDVRAIRIALDHMLCVPIHRRPYIQTMLILSRMHKRQFPSVAAETADKRLHLLQPLRLAQLHLLFLIVK